VTGSQLGIPPAVAVAGHVGDASVTDFAQPHAAGDHLIVADLLVLLVLGDET
jgi:hypothetical protein